MHRSVGGLINYGENSQTWAPRSCGMLDLGKQLSELGPGKLELKRN